MATHKRIDRVFLVAVLTLVVIGFFIFVSASLGLLARDGASFASVAFSQLFLGIILGLVALTITTNIHYRFWRKYAFYIFLFSAGAALLVFIPGFGFEHAGARRWLDFGLFSFQPAELLKIGFVIYFATWLSGMRNKINSFQFGLLPFLVIISIVAFIMLAQPDTGTFLVIFSAGIAMYIVAGARSRDIVILVLIALFGMALVAHTRPYVLDRLLTFVNPASDPLGSSYQLNQSLIAIGSGEIFGRGFGQSVQKFQYLPEPIGDSIFAVAAEEFGFVGAAALILLLLFIAYRGLMIAIRAPDYFSGLLAVGIVILIVAQSLANIASMLGVLPLTGLPLLFVSHGGTALFFALAEVGILLNISKYRRR